MKPLAAGVILTLLYVTIEAVQFVFFGGLFQRLDPFFFGFVVFGLTCAGFLLATWATRRDQLSIALSHPRQLLAINLCALVTFSAYLLSVQLVEPAITYTISAGVMPLTAYALYYLGMQEGSRLHNPVERIGALLIALGVLFLAIVTVMGMSGFVRGGAFAAMAGIVLAILDGVFFTVILVYSQRLDVKGVGPSAVLGIRLPLYVIVTGLFVVSSDPPAHDLEAANLVLLIVAGLVLTVLPLYLLQKAVSKVSTLIMSAITALGPLVIFALQMVEGRVDYSTATLTGLAIYCSGALFSAFGAVRTARTAHETSDLQEPSSP